MHIAYGTLQYILQALYPRTRTAMIEVQHACPCGMRQDRQACILKICSPHAKEPDFPPQFCYRDTSYRSKVLVTVRKDLQDPADLALSKGAFYGVDQQINLCRSSLAPTPINHKFRQPHTSNKVRKLVVRPFFVSRPTRYSRGIVEYNSVYRPDS